MGRVWFPRLVWLYGVFLLAACAASPASNAPGGVGLTPTPAPTATPTNLPPEPTATTPATIAPRTQAPAPAPTATPDQPLSTTGPWLVFGAAAQPDRTEWQTGLFAVNADGTGLMPITSQPVLPFHDARAAVSPQGHQIAFITGSERPGSGELTLNVLTLPQATIDPVAPLTPEGYVPAQREADPDLSLAMLAVEEQAPAWSPRGTHVAFVGLRDGPSADLYVYSVFTRRAVRMSEEPGHAIRPRWSPDGKYIAYGVVRAVGIGQGQHADEVWVAWTGGGGTRQLVELGVGLEGGGPFRFDVIGWSGPQTLLVAAWDDAAPAACSRMDLREVNVWTGERRVLWRGDFRHVAHDPESGKLLIVASNDAESCAGESGWFLVEPDKEPLPIASASAVGPVQSVRWSPERGVFTLAIGEYGEPVTQVVSINLAGETDGLTLAAGMAYAFAPDGEQVAWYGCQPGEVACLWVGVPGDLPQPVFSETVSEVTWSPGGQSLFFFRPPGVSDINIYVARAPDFVAMPLTTHIQPITFAWLPGPVR